MEYAIYFFLFLKIYENVIYQVIYKSIFLIPTFFFFIFCFFFQFLVCCLLLFVNYMIIIIIILYALINAVNTKILLIVPPANCTLASSESLCSKVPVTSKRVIKCGGGGNSINSRNFHDHSTKESGTLVLCIVSTLANSSCNSYGNNYRYIIQKKVNRRILNILHLLTAVDSLVSAKSFLASSPYHQHPNLFVMHKPLLKIHAVKF